MPTVTSPVVLDETLQSTNSVLQTQNGKMDSIITKLQGIIDALGLDPTVYKPSGSKTCAELTSSLLIRANLGNVYDITDNGTTTSDFVEGAGKPIHLGDNVVIVDIGTGGTSVYKFDLLAGMVDLSNYVEKETGKGLSTNDYTTNEKNKLAGISVNANKVEASETNGNIQIDDVETQVYDDSDLQNKTSILTATAQGNPISFTTLSAQNAESAEIGIEPIQDLHGYSKPWVGGAGKNKWSLAEPYSKNNTTTYVTEAISLSAGTYTISLKATCSSSSNQIRLRFRDVSDNVLVNVVLDANNTVVNSTFTLNADCTKVNIYGANSTSEYASCTLSQVQIEAGSSATSYEPYENLCPIFPGVYSKNLYSGNSTVSGTLNAGVNISILSPGTYTLSAIVSSSDTDDTVCLVRDATNGTSLGTISRSTKRTSITFTLTNSMSIIQFYASATYATSEGDTFSFSDIQIEVGTQATSYEPYDTHKIEILGCGKNLFSPDKILAGTIVDGAWRITTELVDSLYKIPFKANIQYTFSGYEQQSAVSKMV